MSDTVEGNTIYKYIKINGTKNTLESKEKLPEINHMSAYISD